MSISAQAVMDLRQQTGRPMMECKKALTAAGGDLEKAIEELRKAGMKAVEKLADRAANEGRVGHWLSEDGKAGALLALRCETEPVTKNEVFQGLLVALVDKLVKENPKDLASFHAIRLDSGRTVAEELTEAVQKIRENFTIGNFARFDADAVVQYVHFDGKKAAMVALTGKPAAEVAELGKDLCMHVVMYRPAYLHRDEVPAAEVAREKALLVETLQQDPKNAKKPAEILEKIVEGQVGKFYAERCFLEQPFIKDDKRTVTEVVEQAGLKLERFAFVSTGA